MAGVAPEICLASGERSELANDDILRPADVAKPKRRQNKERANDRMNHVMVSPLSYSRRRRAIPTPETDEEKLGVIPGEILKHHFAALVSVLSSAA